MEKLFRLSQYKTNVRTEILAGLTTFFTMAYIIFVNPNILGASGMNPQGVFVATILAAALGTLLMAFLANLPYAQASGMGLNAFFAYTVCGTMGFVWQEALAMVFLCGLVGIIITATKVRRSLIAAIPVNLQHAMGGGVGVFIAYIGLKNGGLINFADTMPGLTPGAQVVPKLVEFNSWGPILTVIGIAVTVVLLVRKVKAALFIGILVTTALAFITGYSSIPEGFKAVDVSAMGGIKEVAFAFFGDKGLASLFADSSRILTALVAMFAFLMSDIFDTIGTFIGTGRSTGIFDQKEEKILQSGKGGFTTRLEKGLFADATASMAGSLFGTSNVTTYVESASGISVGGRTGLTALTTAVLFLLCLPFAALVTIVPGVATAPALIVVGILMMENFAKIKWSNMEEAVPAFFSAIVMALVYDISYGIAAGFIFYCLIKICTGKVKEIHPLLGGATVLFLFNFVLQAVT